MEDGWWKSVSTKSAVVDESRNCCSLEAVIQCSLSQLSTIYLNLTFALMVGSFNSSASKGLTFLSTSCVSECSYTNKINGICEPL